MRHVQQVARRRSAACSSQASCVRFASAIRVTSRRKVDSPSPKTPGLPEGLCRSGSVRRPGRPLTPGSSGCADAEATSACGPPERNVSPSSGVHSTCLPKKTALSQARVRANTKFTQPQVWPTPVGRTGLHRTVDYRDNQPTPLRGCSALQTEVCCHPVVIGPRTHESVRLADRARHNRPV